MLDFLFNVIVYPIQIIINIAFVNIADFFNANVGMAIIGVSFVISMLCLPMYDKAHKLSEEESELQKKMEPKLKSIKKNFKGDERHMLISTYYRENHYSPFMALRNSLSLFIQIPFFIAAYLFFSHLPILQGQSFLFLKNLGTPDGLIHIGKHALNLMPILMTVINIIAGEIYTKGHGIRERIQIYGVGIIFLVLLYNSPSGLVLYWTFNNIFSLFKNISYCMKSPSILLYEAFWLIYIGILVYWCLERKFFYYNYCAFGLFFVILILSPFVIRKAKMILPELLEKFAQNNKDTNILLFLAGLAVCMLLGTVVPFNIVSASPFEFSFIETYSSPLEILLFPFYQALGVFVFWPICLSKMFSTKVKNVLIAVIGGVLFISILNIFIFNVKYNSLTSILTLDNPTVIMGFKPIKESLCIVSNIFAFLLFTILVFYRKTKILNNIITIILLSEILFVGYNGVKIQKDFLEYDKIKKETDKTNNGIYPFLNMTKNGKNVIVFMFDRAISSFLPIIFEKMPELKPAFDGFTYYPNTVSYSSHTITAAAPMYGGYEYTPEMQNLKSDRLMVDKHNEAIFTLPLLFIKNGWRATMSDAPLVDYKWVGRPETFKSKGIEYDNLVGKYSDKYKYEQTYSEAISEAKILIHNFLFFSFMNASAMNNRITVYQGGKYWNAQLYDQHIKANTKTGLDNYSALFYLPDITVAASDKNSFFFLQNELTHTDFDLEYPDYVPKVEITDYGPDFFHDEKTYRRYKTNVAMVILTAKWLNKMRELGVYNNTRIILVSDHGIEVKIPKYSNFLNERITPYNPLLLIKDFNAKGDLKTDNTFMTNADVPYYATLGVVDQINPVTNKKFTTEPKKNGVNILLDFKRVPAEYKGGNCIDEKSTMWHVKDDIFNPENWSDIKPSSLQIQKGAEGKKLKK